MKRIDKWQDVPITPESPIIGIPFEDYGLGWGSDYIEAVHRHGGRVVVLENEIPTGIHGIVLRGGADIDPKFYGEAHSQLLGFTNVERDIQEYEIGQQAVKQGIPLLGICRGHQMLNVVCNGSLFQDLSMRDEKHGTVSLHQVKPSTTKKELLSWYEAETHSGGQHVCYVEKPYRLSRHHTFKVNSYHHQAVKKLGDNLHVLGRSKSGVVEMIMLDQTVHPFALGCQFHPEMMTWSKVGSTIWQAFIGAATDYKETIE